MQKFPKNRYILKKDGHFRISHSQISFKKFLKDLQKCSLFFYYVGGWKNDQGFSQNKTQKN